MTGRLLGMALTALAWTLATGGPVQAESRILTGWGIDEKNLETFLPQARAVGFEALITGNNNPQALARIVSAAQRHQIRIYSCLSPMGGLGSLWKKHYPEQPVPWQVMSEEEETALRFITAGNNRYLLPYQFGGEPVLTHEVLIYPIICLSSNEARKMFEPVIDGLATVPGLAGVSFDGFGYQNYQRCYCDRCTRLLAAYQQAHPDLPPAEAATIFFRDLLVNYLNTLADYARSRRPDFKTSIHLWPVFAPEPLYGNRLNVDECGQTAAWYTLWPVEKIAAYSRRIVGEAKKYHPRQEGVGMIGYYDRPGQFPVKDAARIDLEIKTMLDHGCRHIQVCSTLDVVKNQAIAEVFNKYFGPDRTAP